MTLLCDGNRLAAAELVERDRGVVLKLAEGAQKFRLRASQCGATGMKRRPT